MLAGAVGWIIRAARDGGCRVLEAAFWGLAAASTLLLGAALAIAVPWSRRAIGLVAGFGAGALIAAVTLDLTASAFAAAGIPAVTVGLALGATAFSVGNLLIHRGGPARHRKRSHGRQKEDPLGILLGTILDGIPESVVIGISLLAGEGIGVAFLAAVAISNLPEAIASTTGLRAPHDPSRPAGPGNAPAWSVRQVMLLWLVVVLLSAVAAGLGYALLAGAPPVVAATIQAFAAGAVLAMLADTMMPEAFEDAGQAVGVVTVLGYAIATLLTLA
jgi:ZIP family zinc transporter